MKERNQKAKELQQKLAHRVVASVNPEDLLDYEEIPEGVKVLLGCIHLLNTCEYCGNTG